MNQNIFYKTDEIERFYKEHRTKWEHFYPSERRIFETIKFDAHSNVLDIGCGCGGLGNALRETFGVLKYTGVDINEKAILVGKSLFPELNLVAGDIINFGRAGIKLASFDVVISLSCIDWNTELDKMLSIAIACLKREGKFISSFRLTNQRSIYSIQDSFQYINFSGKLEGEKAPYVVMNFNDLKHKLLAYSPEHIHTYGYMGKPSQTAVTPYQQVCFSVICLTKGPSDTCRFNIELPEFIAHAPSS